MHPTVAAPNIYGPIPFVRGFDSGGQERSTTARLSPTSVSRRRASVALMASARFLLRTYLASRTGVWDRVGKSRAALSCHQWAPLLASVGRMALSVVSLCVVRLRFSFGSDIPGSRAPRLAVGLLARHQPPEEARLCLRERPRGARTATPVGEGHAPPAPRVSVLACLA